jgi:hypothetical protein
MSKELVEPSLIKSFAVLLEHGAQVIAQDLSSSVAYFRRLALLAIAECNGEELADRQGQLSGQRCNLFIFRQV